jgi:hypothetical protein
MKMLPIFHWWYFYYSSGNIKKDKVQMRIGFRADEYDRMERFFNGGENKGGFKIPISCKTYGAKHMVHETFDWRFCHMPLIKNQIQNYHVLDYWKNNGWIEGNLFSQIRRQIKFPAISNCVGCFHKKEETLATECILNPEKMNWFSEKEMIGKGTWLDNKKTYAEIAANKKELAREIPLEIQLTNYTCDSEGCTA